MKVLYIFFVTLVFTACNSQNKKKVEDVPKLKQPNIVWIVTEDISPTLSFYGDNTAKTPNLDNLNRLRG